MKRDDVTGLAPTGDLGLIDKSSFLFDALLLIFGPDGKKNKIKNFHDCHNIKSFDTGTMEWITQRVYWAQALWSGDTLPRDCLKWKPLILHIKVSTH